MAHYAAEAPFLEELGRHAPRVADKMTAQHDEVLEIAGHPGDALEGGRTAEVLRA